MVSVTRLDLMMARSAIDIACLCQYHYLLMVSKEQEAVLRMVAEGSLTAEQGAELLDTLGQGPQAAPRPSFGLGELVDEALARALGRHLRESYVAHNPPRPPRPPRPPGGHIVQGTPGIRHKQPRHGGWAPSPGQGLSFEDLVELKTQGVPKAFIDEMRSLFPEIELHELLECYEGGVEAKYARCMVAAFGEIEVAQLVEMHESGVEVRFAAALREQFPDLEPAAVIEAAEEGIDPDDLDYFVGRGHRTRSGNDAQDGTADGTDGEQPTDE